MLDERTGIRMRLVILVAAASLWSTCSTSAQQASATPPLVPTRKIQTQKIHPSGIADFPSEIVVEKGKTLEQAVVARVAHCLDLDAINREAGWIEASVTIDKDGNPERLEVVDFYGSRQRVKVLESIARRAIGRCRPYIHDGKPVTSFTLRLSPKA